MAKKPQLNPEDSKTTEVEQNTVTMLNPNQNVEPKEADAHQDMVKAWELEGWKIK